MSSILDESRRSRRKSKMYIFVILAIIGGLLFYFLYWNNRTESDPESLQIELVKEIFDVKRDDLLISIDSEGKVVNEDSVNLSFPYTGMKITNIYVTKGSTVKKGDEIAKLESSSVESELKSAEASMQEALLNLETAQNGGTDLDLDLAKKNLESQESKLQDVLDQNKWNLKNAKLNLEDAERNLRDVKRDIESNQRTQDMNIDSANLSVNQTLESAVIELNSVLTDIDDSINEVDDIFDDDDAEDLLGSEKRSSLRNAEDAYDDAEYMYRQYGAMFPSLPQTQEEIFIQNALEYVYQVLETTWEMLDLTLEMLDNTETDDDFTENDLDRIESSISSFRNDIDSDKDSILRLKQSIESDILSRDSKLESANISMENDETKLLDAEQRLRDAQIDYDKTVEDAASDEEDARLQLEIAKNQYHQSTDAPTSADLASLQAQIDKAQVQVDQAKYDLDLTILKSPIDGEVTELNGTVDDIITEINNEPFIVIVNRNKFYVDISVEEADISKLKLGQKVYVNIEALDDIRLSGKITNIAVTGEVDNNGVVSYEVRALIDDSVLRQSYESTENPLRAGMTASVEFIISETRDVLVVPVSAVKRVDNNPSVELESGEWVSVKTGFTDGKMVEVLSGLSAGDRVNYTK